MRWYAKTYVGAVMAFFYLPIAVLILYSFNESKSRSYFTGFTMHWYKSLFTNELIIRSLWNTLFVAVVSAVLATIIGTAAAIGLSRMHKAVKSVILNFTYLPMINPEIVTGVSFMLLFVSLQGLLGAMGAAPFSFGFATLILAHVTFNIPYVILNVMPKLRQVDNSVYEAAQDLGCAPLQAFARVVVPDIMPGIIAGFLTSITMSVDDFVISYFVSGPTSQTLPVTIFSMMRRKVSPEVNALSTILFIVVLTVLLLVNMMDARREKAMNKRMGANTIG